MQHAVPARRPLYDHLIRQIVSTTSDLGLARSLCIPDSTARSWLRRGMPPVIALRTLDESDARALIDTARLKRQHATLIAIVGLLLAMLRAHGIRLEPDRNVSTRLRQCSPVI